MGTHVNIAHDKFPRQSNLVGAKVNVCFNYNLKHQLVGRLVRDDIDDPWESIILLDDGRYVRASECQYSIPSTNKED